MVRNIFLTLFVLLQMVFVSCSSSGGNSPEDAARKYIQLSIDENFEELVEYIAYDEGTTEEELKQGKAMVLALLQAGKSMNEELKIKSFEVGTAEISDDGNTAKVKVSYVYDDGNTKEDDMTLRKVDGKWLWTMD